MPPCGNEGHFFIGSPDAIPPAGIIKDMESGKTLVLELVDSNLLALTTTVPLAQFAFAHKGAPVKTLEQYVDE